MPKKGKEVLMARECSTMVSTWNEYLCIERLGLKRFALSTCGHELLGSVYDLIPEADLVDENGDMVIPESLNGQPVSLQDGEYLVVETLIESASCEPAEFGVADLGVALNFCRESEWTREPHFMRVWRQIQDMVRLDGGAPVGQFKPVPASYLQLIDDLGDRGTGRSRRRRGFKRLGAWVATEDWDLLVDDSPGGGRIGAAMELLSPASFLSDRDLVDYEGRDSKQALNDGDRIRYARARLAILAEQWDDFAPSVIAYPIQHSDGTHAFLCGLVRIRGQAGPEVEWHGPFKSLNH